MDMYSFEEINASIGDCLAWATGELGMVPTKGSDHFNIPWREGSDSGALHIFNKGWKDHKTGEAGTAFDLYVKLKGNNDIFVSQDALGRRFNLVPKMKINESRRIVKEYIYETLEGKPVHKTVRYEPKDFSQAHWDSESKSWKPGLGKIETVLYRLKDWIGSGLIVVVGGEKDADNAWSLKIPATTNALGEGHWKDAYNPFFKGKDVVIVPDNDDVGRKHSVLVAWNVKDLAKSVKIVPMPGVPEKGDLSDWIQQGRSLEEFLKLVGSTQPLKDFEEPDSQRSIQEASEAKLANARPFKNYRVLEIEVNGSKRQEKKPVGINELLFDIQKRFWHFPRAIGASIFDHDRKTGRIRFLEKPSELFAWIQEKSGHPVLWASKIEGLVSQAELYDSVRANCRQYAMISGVPNWPPREDVYYTHGELPKPTPDAKFFNEFVNFFSPATDEDKTLLRVFFASPIYYKPKTDRPLWIIDATTGQGTGKSKLVEMMAFLYGGTDSEQGDPLFVGPDEIRSEQAVAEVRKRLLSRTGRKKRIFQLDNVTGFFQSNELATMITSGCLTGRAPYGHGEESRVNDLTYVITSNCANVSRDLAARAFFIHLAKPATPIPNWESKVQDFILKRRLEIIADIIGILEKGVSFDAQPSTRFKGWELDVMRPMCGSFESYNKALRMNNDKCRDSDGEAEMADEIRIVIAETLKTEFLDPSIETFIPNSVVTEWIRKAMPDFGGKSGRFIPHLLRNFGKTGMIPEIHPETVRYPSTDKGAPRGIGWNWSKRSQYRTPQVIERVFKSK